MNQEIKQTKQISVEVKHVSDIIGEWGNCQRALFIYIQNVSQNYQQNSI